MNRDRLRYASFQPAFQKNRIMEKIENDDHVYIDIDIAFDPSNETTDLSSPAVYSATKTEAILKNPSNYHLVVDRFTLPGFNLPSYIFDPDKPGTVRLSYDGEDQEVELIWNPISTIDPSLPEYYFAYDYQNWIDMLNLALETAFNNLVSKPAGALIAPYVVWDTDASKFILYAEKAYFDQALALPIKIAVDEGVGEYLRFLPYISFDKAIAPAKDFFELIIKDYKNNTETINSVDYLFLKQQAIGTGSAWNPVKSIIFTSQSIPVKNTFTQLNESPLNNSNSNSLGILIDFKLDTSNNALGNRKTLLYVPQQNYRRLDLYSEIPLRKIDIKVFWSDVKGRLYPVRINAAESANIKLLFIRKDISSSN
jgi:hypothetical protein